MKTLLNPTKHVLACSAELKTATLKYAGVINLNFIRFELKQASILLSVSSCLVRQKFQLIYIVLSRRRKKLIFKF